MFPPHSVLWIKATDVLLGILFREISEPSFCFVPHHQSLLLAARGTLGCSFPKLAWEWSLRCRHPQKIEHMYSDSLSSDVRDLNSFLGLQFFCAMEIVAPAEFALQCCLGQIESRRPSAGSSPLQHCHLCPLEVKVMSYPVSNVPVRKMTSMASQWAHHGCRGHLQV